MEISSQAGDAPDRTDLLVKVTEQPTGELSFSAGYSSVDQLVLDLGFNQSNFRGRGQDVRARVEIGSLWPSRWRRPTSARTASRRNSSPAP